MIKHLLMTAIMMMSIFTVTYAGNTVIYTVTSIPIKNVDDHVDVCFLDQQKTSLERINSDLKGARNKHEAEEKVKKYDFADIAKSYLCRLKAAQLGISKIPAIVNNDDLVVYGDTDYKHAIYLLSKYKASMP